MNRILRISMVIALLFSLCFSCFAVSAVESDGVISFAIDCKEEVASGESFDVAVNVAENTGVAALRFYIEYDESVLTLDGAVDESLFEGVTLNETKASTVVFVWADSTATENTAAVGTAVTLSFTATEVDEAVATTVKVYTKLANDVLDKDLNQVTANAVTFDLTVAPTSALAGQSKFIAVSLRPESGSGADYVSAGIRFRNRITEELRASASEIGFIGVPTKALNGMTVAEYIKTENNVALTAKALGEGMDEVVYKIVTDEDGNKYYDYQIKFTGLTKEGDDKRLLGLEITVILYVVVDGETLYSDTVSYSYNSIAALEAGMGA